MLAGRSALLLLPHHEAWRCPQPRTCPQEAKGLVAQQRASVLQNHRIIKTGKDLLESPTPPHHATAHIPTALEHSQGW